MSDRIEYFTSGCFFVPMNQASIKFTNDVYNCLVDDEIDLLKRHKTFLAKRYDNDVYRVAKKMAKRMGDDYSEYGFCQLDFELLAMERGYLIMDDGEYINLKHAANFVHLILNYFNFDYGVPMQVVNTCSSPIPNSSNAVAAYVTKREIKWLSTEQWLSNQVNKNKVKLSRHG